jgi:hypothetical protein
VLGGDGEGYIADLGLRKTRIFLQGGLDRHHRIDPAQQFSFYVQVVKRGVARVRLSDGSIHAAELHGYEAAGIGRKEFKLKHLF